MSAHSMHIFIAIPLPDAIKQQLNEWCQHIQKQLSFKKWVLPADYHITVKFLGGVDTDTVEKLISLIGKVVTEQRAFSLEVKGLGTFGKSGSPRILWAGVKGETDPLHALQKNIDVSTESLGFIPENRPYTPHLTIAKNYTGKATYEAKLLDQASNYQLTKLTWEVNEIVLYQTHLGREPMYEPVKIFLFSR